MRATIPHEIAGRGSVPLHTGTPPGVASDEYGKVA